MHFLKVQSVDEQNNIVQGGGVDFQHLPARKGRRVIFLENCGGVPRTFGRHCRRLRSVLMSEVLYNSKAPHKFALSNILQHPGTAGVLSWSEISFAIALSTEVSYNNYSCFKSVYKDLQLFFEIHQHPAAASN